MKYMTFTPTEYEQYKVCFLVPTLNRNHITQYYLDSYVSEDQLHDIVAYNLLKGPKKTKVAMQKNYLEELVPVLRELGVEYIMVCDAEYFRTLSGGKGGEPHLGYVLPSCEEFAGFHLTYCPNPGSFFYNPEKAHKAASLAFTAMYSHMEGKYIEPGCDIITFEEYPWNVHEIRTWLNKLVETPLAADIEAFSLKHYDAGIGTISFAWSMHEGIAFAVDHMNPEAKEIRALLKDFFIKRAELGVQTVWHKIDYDVTVLIYQLFMDDLLDTEGLLEGLDVMLSSWDCTRLISYLATNSCAGNQLGLKSQSQEFSGNYAIEEIKDITKIPLQQLLRYNLIDTLSTWYVYHKNHPIMVADDQLPIYETIFKPGMVDIIHMQLTGMPLNMDKIVALDQEVTAYINDRVSIMSGTTLVSEFERALNLDWVEKKNATLKVKRVSLADAKEKFNPNSDPQLRRLLFDEKFMGLPIFDYTETKLPATGAATLQKLITHSSNEDHIEFLEALLEFKKADKIKSTFVKAMLQAPRAKDNWHYLFGCFNLGGTVSGRLSSSDPNLQNLPSSDDEDADVKWAKKVKGCFQAPPGKLWIGLDFDSLEDRISALTTKDENKLKVYIDGFDGHSLRAYSYFGEHMPDIDPESVQSINSIKKKYPHFRRESKVPTFLLTYGGTFIGIMEKMAWPKDKAKTVEKRYHELYKASDNWVANKIQEATKTGYVTVAFGLRVRTPLLHQVVLGNRKTPYEAQAEARTAGNALGQSWCLLNTRAGIEFNSKARKSEYRHKIRPSAHIHDAQYFIIDDDMDTLLYVNEHLTKAVAWQDHPAIWHDTVKLSGELSVFYPTWAQEMVIPHGADPEKIKQLALDHYNDNCQ